MSEVTGMAIFSTFRSTVNPPQPTEPWRGFRLLVDRISGAPLGIQNQGATGPDGMWAPTQITAAQIASPSAQMIADTNATFQLNVAPFTRYVSDGTSLQSTTAGGNFLPLSGGVLAGPLSTTALTIGGPGSGTFTANGATAVSVTAAAVTANSVVVFALKTVGGTVGAYPSIKTITPGVGFTVACTAADTSVYNYQIIS